jgi:hypothetical protein
MGVRVRIALPIAVAMLVVGCGGGGTSSDGTPFACPDPQDQTPMSGADTLPTGATVALLCFHDNRFVWVPPHGQLRTGLDHLVRVVNAQRVHDPNSEDNCGGVGAPGWTVVLRYADGTRTIQGDNGGCWGLAVGSTERFGATT